MDASSNDYQKLHQLSLIDIASWQVNDLPNPEIFAALPALQRGAVWKPRQVELLWDSLIRGFPIGSFMLSPYHEKYGKQEWRNFSGRDIEPTHHLLDGQQRATAIAVGFVNPLLAGDSDLLWIDIPPADGKADDREFVFRVLTRFHPWGFNRTNTERLEAGKIRKGFDDFKKALDNKGENACLLSVSPSKFPLKYAWPVDAQAPLPVAFLRDAKRGELLEKMKVLPYWNSQYPPEWKAKVEKAIIGEEINLAGRLEYAIQVFNEMVKNCRIPCQEIELDKEMSTPNGSNPPSERPDPIETLFVRINSGGTRLEGEELIYSMLKSEWPDAPQFIEDLSDKLTSPARTVVLTARLVLARNQQGRIEKQPPIPTVSMFRRLLRGADKINPRFKEELHKAVFEDGQASVVKEKNAKLTFKTIHKFLSIQEDTDISNQRNYRLHPYLAAELARGSSGHEVLILLMRWADRLLEEGKDPNDLAENTKRRTLGFITALAWFGVKHQDCVGRIWRDLQSVNGKELEAFFNAERFQSLIKRKRGEGVVLIPPVPSSIFTESLEDLSRDIEVSQLGDPQSGYWKNAYFYRNERRNKLKAWREKTIHPLWEEDQIDDVEAWWIDRIWADRRFIIYAQRAWLMLWFPDYDPTVSNNTDMNRPWDYDHIHPSNFVSYRWNIPAFLKQLHWSNGNFRAWPLEANRAIRDAPPIRKLRVPLRQEELYQLNSDTLADASFITNTELELWDKCIPAEYLDTNHSYLCNPAESKENHLVLVQAITSRLGRIYGEWFDTLRLKDLLPKYMAN